MKRPRILALIQAGGKGSRMDVLTRETPKPVLPFAGAYRLLDFPLSNLRNSGVDDVWLSVQYLGLSVADAAGNGKPWDLDRHHGGFKLIVPQEGSGSPVDEGFVTGNAEELLRNRDLIREHGADALVVMSSDHVYRLDYAEVVDEHLSRGAECTIVTTEVALSDASHHATVTSDRSGRVTGFDYKPEQPRTSTVATEVFVYTPEVLIEVLEELHRDQSSTRGADAEDSLGDFGELLVPALVERGHVYAHPLAGYWRDLGRPETYFQAHRELLHSDVDLFDDAWPISTNNPQRVPARVHDGATVRNSLLSGGCQVHGTVTNSVLGPGVVIAAGARVRDCVIFADVSIEAGATLDWAIVDTGVRIGSDAKIGMSNPQQEVTEDYLTIVGKDSRIGSGATVPRGARLEPGTTV
ncbi:MAG: sugar phosphate nucleotidyltransferase [Propionibacteriaceae bacterium]